MSGGMETSKKKSSRLSSKNSKTNICTKHAFEDEEIQNVRDNFLKWYDKEQRKLPWRTIARTESDENIRGYAVWVSEVMLQQTQVSTVIPYFNRWMERWPTVQDLAGAKLEVVLQTWAGLGYYSRARRLHEGAKIVMEQLDGKIPKTVPELMKQIPGIGAYSASAIASVAFQKVTGVVDGNVIRVLSRMRVIGSHVTVSSVRDHLWELANNIVSRDRPGDFNQALMELGAMICTPQNPNCEECPVSQNCHANSMVESAFRTRTKYSFLKKKSETSRNHVKDENDDIVDIEDAVPGCDFCLPNSLWWDNPQVTVFPRKAEKKKPRKETVNVLVIEQEDKYLTTRRPEKGLLAGLLEFPSVILTDDTTSNKNSMQSLVEELGVPISEFKSKKKVGEVVHLFTHIDTTYVVEHLVLKSSVMIGPSEKEVMWLTQDELKTSAISTAMKKVFALVLKTEVKSLRQIIGFKRKRISDDAKQPSIKSFFS